MSYAYQTKVGNTARQIAQTLTLYGRVLDLTDAVVTFVAEHTTDKSAYISRTAEVVDAVKGRVRFQFTAAETKVPGLYNCEWRIVYQDGTVLTVPDNDNITLEIVKGVWRSGNV